MNYIRNIKGMELPVFSDLQRQIASWIGRVDSKTAYFDIPELEVSLGTTTGNVRPVNQDRLLVAAIPSRSGPSFLFALCDGLGGMRDGDVCSTIALSTLTMSLLQSTDQSSMGRLFRAANAANTAVREKYRETGGCTLSAILYAPGEGRTMFSIGDSRVYAYSDGVFAKLSIDDTISEEIKKFNKGSNTDPNPRFNNQLTQFIGSSSALESSSLTTIKPSENTGYLISSDGLHSFNQGMLADIVASAPNCSNLVRRLIALSLWGKSKDNASVIAIPKNIAQKLNDFPNRNHLILWNPNGRADIFCSHDSAISEYHSLGLVFPSQSSHQGELLSVPLNEPEQSASSRKHSSKSKKKGKIGGKAKPKIRVTPG